MQFAKKITLEVEHLNFGAFESIVGNTDFPIDSYRDCKVTGYIDKKENPETASFYSLKGQIAIYDKSGNIIAEFKRRDWSYSDLKFYIIVDGESKCIVEFDGELSEREGGGYYPEYGVRRQYASDGDMYNYLFSKKTIAKTEIMPN